MIAARHSGSAARGARDFTGYYVHEGYVRAIPGPERGRLVNYISALLRFAREAEGRLIVDAPRADLADLAGVTEETTRRMERRLEELQIVRTLALERSARALEILPPPTVPLRPICMESSKDQPLASEGLKSPTVALRVVDNSVPESRQPLASEGLSPSPARGCAARSPYPLILRDQRKSRHARASADCGKLAALDLPDDDPERAARKLGAAVSARLAEASPERTHRLTHTQAAAVRAAIQRRIESWTRMGTALALAAATAKEDLDRVLDYALRAERPAAHLAASLRRDWLGHPPKGCAAREAWDRETKNPRPVQDLDSRQGPAFRAVGAFGPEDDPEAAPSLARALARYERAVRNAPLKPDQRAQLQAIRPVSAGEALELAVDLERATVLASVQPRENL